MKKIISIIGARPQFIKHAHVQLELQKHFVALTIHTGQHYDKNMSDVFFNELNIPAPDYIFDISKYKLHGEQTAAMMVELEKVFLVEKPDAVVIYGDTNSTLAGALVAAKLKVPIIHIEAGLRSFNMEMPEEINRIVADRLSSLLFCPTDVAIANLNNEGIKSGVYKCGDVMYDTMLLVKDKIRRVLDIPYYFATIHRPYNTDDAQRIAKILSVFESLNHKVVFAIHPRTVARLAAFGIDKARYSNIIFIDPLGYVDSLSYQLYSECVITDSGGMQKEAYMLRKKCITIRSETEWVETLLGDWNQLVFEDLEEIPVAINKQPKEYVEQVYGDGNAAAEIVGAIKNFLENNFK